MEELPLPYLCDMGLAPRDLRLPLPLLPLLPLLLLLPLPPLPPEYTNDAADAELGRCLPPRFLFFHDWSSLPLFPLTESP